MILLLALSLFIQIRSGHEAPNGSEKFIMKSFWLAILIIILDVSND